MLSQGCGSVSVIDDFPIIAEDIRKTTLVDFGHKGNDYFLVSCTLIDCHSKWR